MESEPVVDTVRSAMYQPCAPSGARSAAREADGPVLSSFTVMLSLADPPALCAEHEEGLPLVSEVKGWSPQPGSRTTVLSGSVTLQWTTRFEMCHACRPAVPVIG